MHPPGAPAAPRGTPRPAPPSLHAPLVPTSVHHQVPLLPQRKRQLPRGVPEVRVVKGGLDCHDVENDTFSVIATAAVEAFLDIDPDDWQLATKA